MNYQELVQIYRRLNDEMQELREHPPTIIVHTSQEDEIRVAVNALAASAAMKGDLGFIEPVIQGSEWAVDPGQAIIFNAKRLDNILGVA